MEVTTMTLEVSVHDQDILHKYIANICFRAATAPMTQLKTKRSFKDTTQFSVTPQNYTGILLTPKLKSTRVGEAGGYASKMLVSG
jgi:hypothetical protein